MRRASGFFLISAVILFTAACSLFEKHEEEPVRVSLDELHAVWIREIAETADPETGWPSRDDCDATLWAGLAYAAGATSVKIDLAEHKPGEIQRRPYTPCWPNDLNADGLPDSRSTISQDMLTGYLWALWRRGDYPAAFRVASYGEDSNWVMGEPFPGAAGEVVMRNLVPILGRLLYALSGGQDARSYRIPPPIFLPVAKDYERHIQTLAILLSGELTGPMFSLDIDGESLKRLHENAEYDPKDALFQAALSIYTGDASAAEALLRDPSYECPSYVRGAPTYCTVHKAFAASILIAHNLQEH